MKQLLQTLFFFLLVTQISFAQWYQQTSGINLNTKSGMTDRMDKHHKIMGANIKSGKNNEFSTTNFNDKLPTEINPFELNNKFFPFQNDRRIPNGLQKNSSSIHRLPFLQSQIYVIDTVIVRRLGNGYDSTDFGDTSRHLYSFNASSKKTSELMQKLKGGIWVDMFRETIIFNENDDMLSQTYEYSTNSQWIISSRYTCTYDAHRRVLTQCWEGWSNGQLESGQKYTYTYDANGNTLSEMYQGWANGQWENNYRITNTYDATGNILSFLYEDWINGQWEKNYRATYTYDDTGYLLSSLEERWLNGKWEKESQTTYSYDANGKKLYEFGENWYDGQVTYRARISYTYDAEGREIVVLCESSWYTEQLSFSWRNTYTYNAEGRLTSLLEEYIDTNGGGFGARRETYSYNINGNQTFWAIEYLNSGQWEVLYRGTSTYDANGNLLFYMWESLSNGQLSQASRDTYQYDADNRNTSKVSEYFNGNWENITRWTYGYDTEGNMTSIWHYRWKDSSWTIANYPIYGKVSPGPPPIVVYDSAGNSYSYSSFYNIILKYRLVVTEIESVNDNMPIVYYLTQNYPNPFNPSTKISFSIPLIGGARGGSINVKVIVYDILGNEIATLVKQEKEAGSYEVEFDASKLSSGVYFYRIQAGNFIDTKKMILLR